MKIATHVTKPFSLKKSLGQHFLYDLNVIEQIIGFISPQDGDHIVEVGPGAGALTTKLLPSIHSLDVIELDQEVIPQLEKNCNNLGKLNIHVADVLRVDFSKFKTPLRLVGNLPYNISTPLLFKMIDNIGLIKDLHFMLQKEVADRIAAVPGTKIYGRLSVMIQYYYTTTVLFYIGPKAFFPQPKVDSAFIRLIPRKNYSIVAQDKKVFSDIVREAFCYRRKTVGNSLKKYFTVVQLREIGIDPNLRPEQLHVDDFVRMSNCFSF